MRQLRVDEGGFEIWRCAGADLGMRLRMLAVHDQREDGEYYVLAVRQGAEGF